MKKITRNFLPVYNEVIQVKNCVRSMIGQEIIDVNVIINIGFNGREYVSSTEWMLKTAGNEECILPFSITPQYPTFISMVAGTSISNNNGNIMFEHNSKQAIIITPDGNQRSLSPGEPVRIVIADGAKNFVCSDCVVEVTENNDAVTYTIIPDESTHYGKFIKGMIVPAN